jgi:hypothetical protein
MQTRVTSPAVLLLILTLALLGPGRAQAATAKNPAASRTNTVPTFTAVEIPQSVFSIPPTPRDGRNPFFPQSIQQAPSPITHAPSTAVDFSSIILNGITSPPRRTAMINGRTFEPGEEGEVKLPSGARVMIKCEEIRADSAVVRVNGQPRELRLRFGL